MNTKTVEEKEFCKMYSGFFGEEIDNIKQLFQHNFSGEELQEFVEHCIKQKLLTPSPERGKELTDKCPTCGALCEIGGSGTDKGSTCYFIPKSNGVLGKEGKTAEELKEIRHKIIKSHLDKRNNNDCIDLFFDYHNAMQEYAELYAQSTSKPVEPKTSVGEEGVEPKYLMMARLGKFLNEHRPNLNDRQFEEWKALITDFILNDIGLSMQQGRGEEWISVEERLPEEGMECLISDYFAVTYGVRFIEGKWYSDILRVFMPDNLKLRVTHWMPLPKFTQSRGTE